MSLDGLLHFPWLDANVPLGDGSAAVLEELLHQGNVIVAVLIDLGGVVLPEAVGTDVPIAQVVTDGLEMSLDGPLGHREYPLLCLDFLIQAVASDELIERQRNGEHPGLSSLLLCDRQAVAFPVLDDVGEAEL